MDAKESLLSEKKASEKTKWKKKRLYAKLFHSYNVFEMTKS